MMNTKSANSKKPGLDISLAYQGFLEEPVPSDIFDAIVSGKVGMVFRVLKTILILGVGALIAIIALSMLDSDADVKTTSLESYELATSSHKTFALDQVYPVQVGVDDKQHLVDWLSYRMGKRMQITPLNEFGYSLLGGNIVPDNNLVSASIVYENQDGIKLSMFVRNLTSLTVSASKPESGRLGSINWLSWHEKGRQIVLASELTQSALEDVYEGLR